MRRTLTSVRCGALAFAAVLAACGGSDDEPTGRPVVVVTTNMLGDIVTTSLGEMVGTEVDIEVIMPAGTDPHEFAPSARQAESMENADLLVVNGLGAEEAMEDIVANVRDGGTTVFVAADALGSRQIPGDPHIWLDPDAMATVVTALATELPDATGLDRARVDATTTAYVGELRALDASISSLVGTVAPERRSLVTNHDALAYFARRYGFTVDGTVIASVSTAAEPSAAELERLAADIRERSVPAIFVETTESDRLARAVADEAGDVEIVELFTGSLGGPGSGAETYVAAMRLNAERIAEALG